MRTDLTKYRIISFLRKNKKLVGIAEQEVGAGIQQNLSVTQGSDRNRMV